jgi:quinol monooxygenase YgiN
MSELTVIATIQARSGDEDTVREGLLGLIAPTRAEEGCLNYDLHRDLEDPGRFVFHENWESRAHLDRHLASAHIVANRERIGEMIASLTVKLLERID